MSELVDLLNFDLANEYSHMIYYTVQASSLLGKDRLVFSGFFKNNAKSEMVHVIEFQDLIVRLGGVPVPRLHPVPVFSDIESALKHAINMEQEVVNNYLSQLSGLDKMSLSDEDRLRVKLFLEKQFEDSRHDLEELRNMS